jgi:hypothetical protein
LQTLWSSSLCLYQRANPHYTIQKEHLCYYWVMEILYRSLPRYVEWEIRIQY